MISKYGSLLLINIQWQTHWSYNYKTQEKVKYHTSLIKQYNKNIMNIINDFESNWSTNNNCFLWILIFDRSEYKRFKQIIILNEWNHELYRIWSQTTVAVLRFRG